MKILITGGSGMVGSQFVGPQFFKPASAELNLMDREKLKNNLVEKEIDQIIHLAARVGGVQANTLYVGDFAYENMQMNQNLLSAALEVGVKKVISMLSTCVYPDERYVNYPLTEDQLHAGPPHNSNFGYAYSKRFVDVQSRAYRQQYGANFITAIPNNLYGPNDNYHIENSHVIPAMIRKFYEAKLRNKKEVVLWGTGSPLREFTYSKDISKIILWLLENYDGQDPVNIGNTDEISIESLSKLISDAIGYDGKIIFDSNKPDGQYRKPSSNLKLRNLGCNIEYTPLKIGLKETIDSFVSRYPNIRGM